MYKLSLIALIIVYTTSQVYSALIINAPLPITHQVNVQPIVVSTSDGSETATFLGTPDQQDIIEGYIDQIWAQAGVDVNFLTTSTYSDDFIYDGSPFDYSNGSGNKRPGTDLAAMFDNYPAALNNDATVLNMFFVDIVPQFEYTSLNTTNGLAWLDSNGVAVFVGENLLSFQAGQEAVATLIAHEIGHNLGLDHEAEAFNLMQAGGSPNPGAILSADQVQTIFIDDTGIDGFDLLQPYTPFTPIPEPTTGSILSLGLVGMIIRRSRA